jgi:peptidoglycan/LPS O-acetylase OafA/YrhL
MPRPERLYFLDNLRAVVIILVIVLHASLTYMVAAPTWWYVLDPLRSGFFDLVVILTDIPIMLVLFFLAGYFAYPSLERRGPGDFMRDKLVRIGLPCAFGARNTAPKAQRPHDVPQLRRPRLILAVLGCRFLGSPVPTSGLLVPRYLVLVLRPVEC